MGRSVWPELIFADEAPRESLSRAVTAGRLRRIARGVYTSSNDALEAVTRRHLPQIVVHELPGAVLIDASARSGRPSANGDLYVDHGRDRRTDRRWRSVDHCEPRRRSAQRPATHGRLSAADDVW